MTSLTHEEPMEWRDWFADDRVVLGALTLALAWFLGSTFMTSPACLFVATITLIVVVSIRLRWPEPVVSIANWKVRMARGVVLFGSLLGSVLIVFAWRFYPALQGTPNVLLVAVDSIGHAAFMLMCVLWMHWPRRGHVMMLVLGMLVMLMSVAGGGLSTTVTAQTALGLMVCIGFVLATRAMNREKLKSQSVAGLPTYEDTPKRIGGGLYRFMALFAMLIAASATTHATIWFLPDVQAGVMAQLNDRLEATTSRGWGGTDRYVSGSRLGNVRESILSDPAAVALRGFAKTEPGYLRGNVYDSYSNGRWRTSRKWIFQSPPGSGVRRIAEARFLRPSGIATMPLQNPDDHVRQRYSMRFGSLDDEVDTSIELMNWNGVEGNDLGGGRFVGTVEIHGEPTKGQKVFLPASARWVELAGDGVGITPHGLLGYGVEVRWPWVVGVQENPPAENLSEEDREALVRVESEIHSEIEALTESLMNGAKTDAERAERVALYFQNNYEYSLDPVTVSRKIDPLTYFIQNRHPAHCELFASATALMLRTVDIPTRYVTGYIMDELNDAGDTFLARNRDAHAWVEYYDKEVSRWLPVESTPGRSYLSMQHEEVLLASAGGGGGGEQTEDITTSWFAPILSWWASLRTTDTLVTLFRWLQVPLLIFLVTVLWRRNRKKTDDQRSVLLAAERRRMDRRIRRLGWVRRPSETLHTFAGRLESEAIASQFHEELLRAANWYRDHAVQCYRGDPVTASLTRKNVAVVQT
ncbi:transglutaminase-like domain-containing protein [Rhodopirellula bahusiensis]|uniref:transglutaminase-like domain-containing protein n=1 Tax=Rhodopirellula bahusiensis TaxID=2014065 RepID=UPI003265ABE8